MPKVSANGITLNYEMAGAEGAPVLLVICGHAGQLTAVPDAFMAEMVKRGFRVIRFDNRDTGLSTKFDAAGLPDWPAINADIAAGRKPSVAYTLSDMAEDAVGLLDALGIAKAHLLGGSMGGMIAQLVAANFPDRVLSLTSAISSSSNPDLPGATAEAVKVMSMPIDPAGGDEAIADYMVRMFQTIGSPGYPVDEKILRARMLADVRRCWCPDGAARQSAAIVATGDRRPSLRKITAPTVVLHGEFDPLLPLACGEDTAANIPGAKLRVVKGMGHDFPDALAPVWADAVCEAAGAARSGM